MGVADVVHLHGQDPALVCKETQPPGCPAGGPGRGGPGSRGYAWSAQPDRTAGRRYGRGGGESIVARELPETRAERMRLSNQA